MAFRIKWEDYEREPQQAPDPHYPDGMDIDGRRNRAAPSCKAHLPYPAKRCGAYLIECLQCGLTMYLTTAGRADDPRSVLVNCKPS